MAQKMRVADLDGKKVLLVNDSAVRTKEQVQASITRLADVITKTTAARDAPDAEKLVATFQASQQRRIDAAQTAKAQLEAVVDELDAEAEEVAGGSERTE